MDMRDQRPGRTARIGVRQQTGKLPAIDEAPPEAAMPPDDEPITSTPGDAEPMSEPIAGPDGPDVIRMPAALSPRFEPASTDEAPRVLALTWEQYGRWRQGKCPPQECRGAIWLDELDQALHELHGEVAELAEIIIGNEVFVMAADAEADRLRRAVADEIGDAIFTASWVFDCIEPSYLATRGRIAEGFLAEDSRAALAMTCDELQNLKLSPAALHAFDKLPDDVQAAAVMWRASCRDVLLMMSTNAGLVSGRFKKLRWHRIRIGEDNPFYDQAQNVLNVMLALDGICALLGVGLLTCVRRNMTKLDRRFPDGWRPGGGERRSTR